MKNCMQKLQSILACLLVLLATLLISPIQATAETTVVQGDTVRSGRFSTIRITLTADAAAGAVLNKVIDLSDIFANRFLARPYYFYFLWPVPGEGAAAPDAHTATFADPQRRNATVLAHDLAGTDTAPVDAAEDLPNYWPVTGNLLLNVTDIGASNTQAFDLIFSE